MRHAAIPRLYPPFGCPFHRDLCEAWVGFKAHVADTGSGSGVGPGLEVTTLMAP